MSWAPLAGSAAVVGTVALAFGGVHVEEAVTGRQIRAADLADYAKRLEQAADHRAITIEGKSAIVSVYATPTERLLRTNGLPEASVRYEQPYAGVETLLLGFWPYALARIIHETAGMSRFVSVVRHDVGSRASMAPVVAPRRSAVVLCDGRIERRAHDS